MNDYRVEIRRHGRMYSIDAYYRDAEWPYTASYRDSLGSASDLAFTHLGATRKAKKMLRKLESPGPVFLETLQGSGPTPRRPA